MATVTTNLGLTKPELTDNITPTIFANNFELIDGAIGSLRGVSVGTSDMTAGSTSLATGKIYLMYE